MAARGTTSESHKMKNVGDDVPILKRQCSRFAANKGELTCKCGYEWLHHTETALNNPEKVPDNWAIDTHTECIPADGEKEFARKASASRLSWNPVLFEDQFIRCDVNTNTDSLKKILFERWKLEKPKILISVTGGAENFEMSPRLKDAFRHSLMDIASIKGAWIITGGTNTGVMKYVGEAIHEHQTSQVRQESCFGTSQDRQESCPKIVLLGVATWGIIANRDPPTQSGPAHKKKGIAEDAKHAFLDPNHTHFILVDDGTHGQYGKEIALRANLEKMLSDDSSVPVACVAVQGGPGTLETIFKAVNKGTPVVVVKGSGGAADFIAKFRNCVQDGNVEAIRGKITEAGRKEFGDKFLDKWVTWTIDILSKSDYVTVFDSSGTTDMDHAILQAILKLNHSDNEKQINLALKWNRADIAKTEIFERRKLEKADLDDAMFQALVDNKLDFVKLFLEHGCDLNMFLTETRLIELYNKTHNGCLLKTILKHQRQSNDRTRPCMYQLVDVGNVIKMLMGGKYSTDIEPRRSTDRTFEDPARELFIYSLLLMRYDMASFFWIVGPCSIAAALTATNLLKAMAFNQLAEDLDAKESLQKHANDFEQKAIGVAVDCYNENDLNAQKLLVRAVPQFGNMTCLDLAVSAGDKDFVGQKFCQTLLTRIWMGKMLTDTCLYQILLCMIFPPAALKLISYREEGDNNSVSEQQYTRSSSVASQEGQVNKDREIKPKGHMKLLYFFNAPITIFMYNFVSAIAYLLFYSYIMLMNFSVTTVPGIPETILIFWTATLVLEEMRQIAIQKNHFSMKIQWWFKDVWNKIDLVMLLLFFTGVGLRLVTGTMAWGRRFYIMSLVICYLRMLHMFGASRQLGPKLLMIGKMTKDLMFFMAILIVFLLSYGVALQALMHPNETNLVAVIVRIMYKPYFQMYGEFFFNDEIDTDADEEMTASSVPTILLVFYVLFVQVLLLNILIAMFSYTFARIQENTDKYWKMQRYSLIKEYLDRPPIPPPFIIISHLYLLFNSLRRCNYPDQPTTAFMISLTCDQVKQLKVWEKLKAENYERKTKKSIENQLDNKISEVKEKVHNISNCQEVSKEDIGQLHNKVKYLEQHIERMSTSVDWMVKVLSEGPIGGPITPPKLQEIKTEKDLAIQDMPYTPGSAPTVWDTTDQPQSASTHG